MLPSDICRIYKKGSSIRLDSTLVDFNDMRWERGDISFLFNGDRKPGQSLTVLDNKQARFQRVRYEVCISFRAFHTFMLLFFLIPSVFLPFHNSSDLLE